MLKGYKIRKYCEAGSYRYLINTHLGFDVLTDERFPLFLHFAPPLILPVPMISDDNFSYTQWGFRF